MSRQLFLSLICIFFAMPAVAFAAADADDAEALALFREFHTYHTRVIGGKAVPQWTGEGDSFWYDAAVPGDTIRYLVDPEAETRKETDRHEKADDSGRNGPPWPKIPSPDGSRYAVVEDGNIWIGTTGTDRKRRLTVDADPPFYGWFVDRYAWSPEGNRLFVSLIDQRRVHKVPVIDYSSPFESVDSVAYAKSGGRIAETELFVIDVDTGRRTRFVDRGEDGYLYFLLGWRPDGSEVLAIRLTRDGKFLDLFAGDPSSSRVRLLLSESRKTFVEGLDFMAEGWLKKYTPLGDNARFLWLSERDGWRHIYLYDYAGTMLGQVTKGEFPVVEVVCIDTAEGRVYFTAHGEKRLYDTHLYRVGLDGAGQLRLTRGDGQHEVEFSPSGRYFVDNYSSVNDPPAAELRTAGGESVMELARADITGLEAIEWVPPEEFVVKAADGKTDLYGVLYKPHDFDPSKRYPVVEYIYAGPFIATVPHTFDQPARAASYAQGFAQLGFITVVLDARGTPGRSKAFQDFTYGSIGKHEIPDHVAAIKRVAKDRPYMDLSRVAVFGHSWGGYFALRAVLQAPEFYDVAIASAPGDLTEAVVINEPYMGRPRENEAGYEAGSNPAIAGNLEGKLLLIHGTADVNAPVSTTMRMVDALVKAGKRFDLLILPQETHFFQGDAREYWFDTLCRYFLENLPAAE